MKKSLLSENSANNAKLRLLIITKKQIIIAILCVIIALVFLFGGMGIAKAASVSPEYKYVVVIDPGHGGIDGGVVSDSGYKESEFNLAMSRDLEKFLTDSGFKVILTRQDENGLYEEDASNKKKSDMLARKKIIEENKPDFVISIHANKYPGDSRRGAQVFFDEMSAEGKSLAGSIQSGLNLLNKKFVGREFSELSGDYFMLKCTQKPSVIVECGFLSNTEDEKLLTSAEYRQQLAFAIYSGIVAYTEV